MHKSIPPNVDVSPTGNGDDNSGLRLKKMFKVNRDDRNMWIYFEVCFPKRNSLDLQTAFPKPN